MLVTFSSMRRRNTGNGDPRIAIGYCRISTDISRQSLGIQAQRNALEQWASKNGIHIAALYIEEVSGGMDLAKRPVLLEAINAIVTHGAGVLVVGTLDRFSRDPLTAAMAEAEIRKRGATLAVVDGAGEGQSPTGDLVRGILLNVAKFERSIIGFRIRNALAVKKRRGELTGKAPYGYRAGADGKTLEVDANETAIIVRMRELRSLGMTYRFIQKQTADEGLLSRAGTPFTLPALHKILKTPIIESLPEAA